MSLTLVGISGILLLLATLLLVGMPVGFAMGVIGFCGMWYIVSLKAALGMIGTELWSTFSSYSLTMIPLFVFMGEVCFHSGLNSRLFQSTYRLTGRVRGGLAMATVLACSLFAAICGSNTATAATMTTVALPEMNKYKYNSILSTGSIACGSTLGVVIPPSVVLIIIGLYTGQSVTKLFYGGIFSGLCLAFAFMLTIYIVCIFKPHWSPQPGQTGFRSAGGSQTLSSFRGLFEALLLFGLVMGGLYSGIFTPTEAGAAGAFCALTLSIIGRRLSWKGFQAALTNTAVISCMVFIIIAGAIIFSRFLTLTRIPFEIAGWVTSLPIPSVGILFIIFFLYIIGGALMDALALLLITIPIFFPVAEQLGYDPIWYGVIITVITTLGAVTPPVGTTTYVVAGMAKDVPLENVFRGVMIFLPAYLFCIILFVIFPQIITFLPNLIR